MIPESKYQEGEKSRCAFDALLWIVVVLLMLCFGSFVLLSVGLSLGGIPAPAVGAAVAAGVFCALLLAMLLLAYFALSLTRFCFATDSPNAKYPDPGKVYSTDKE